MNIKELISQGVKLYTAGDYDGAIRGFSEVIRLMPRVAKAYYWRGIAYQTKHNDASALADYDKALDLDPRLF